MDDFFSLLNDSAWDGMIEYLKNHESDIAHGINDFALLKGLFRVAFGRDAVGV